MRFTPVGFGLPDSGCPVKDCALSFKAIKVRLSEKGLSSEGLSLGREAMSWGWSDLGRVHLFRPVKGLFQWLYG